MAALAIVPMHRTLYSIEEHLQALLDTAEMVPPEQETAFVEDLAQALTNAVEKRDAVAHWMSHCESQIELAKAEIDRLRQRKESFERALDRLKTYVVRVIEAAGVKKLEGSTVSFSIRKCPPSIEILSEPDIPMDYKSVALNLPARLLDEVLDALDFDLAAKILEHSTDRDVSVDKRAIKTAIDAGTRVPGAQLAPEKHSLVRK